MTTTMEIKLRTITLKELKIDRIRPDGEVETVPLTASPYLKSLMCDDKEEARRIYDEYTELLNREFPEAPAGRTYEEFGDLMLDLTIAGFRNDRPDPITVYENMVFDGQHRLAILTYLHGTDARIVLANDQVVGIETA